MTSAKPPYGDSSHQPTTIRTPLLDPSPAMVPPNRWRLVAGAKAIEALAQLRDGLVGQERQGEPPHPHHGPCWPVEMERPGLGGLWGPCPRPGGGPGVGGGILGCSPRVDES